MNETGTDAVQRRLSRVISNHNEISTPSGRVDLARALMEELAPEFLELAKLREGLPAANWMFRPQGPALIYVHSRSDAVTLVDAMPWHGDWEDAREYAILRALLLYCLKEGSSDD